MINYQPLYQELIELKAEKWVDLIKPSLTEFFAQKAVINWLEIIEQLPKIKHVICDLNADVITIGDKSDLDEKKSHHFIEQLQLFHPWRKGPYNIFGHLIDTEWRSDWKWNRLKEHIAPLKNRLVLDVGCGSGYHCWRMLGADARMVVGIEPLSLNVIQFYVIKHLIGESPIYVLPIGLEQIPERIQVFDTVFSMGVLYHRRSPIDHLLELKNCLRSGGELILETLIIDGKNGEFLMPEGRYAKMRNVWFLPSCETLISWMERCGFKNCRLVDVNTTSIEEQKTTEWMRFHSLKDFLDPDNISLTCEGLPAPKRAIIIANAP
ncbi:MAG: tRNA 5-methoxyuridine(34)/uridine 5-oxyacetic acid(34) synthase CmoB [Methylococcaceae bacterium]|nr:tRNA 5-methoxyuridine(34)/uridine 5-oxyacetic acid(34) synthase CmoB [Methylococcaceae bacterium]